MVLRYRAVGLANYYAMGLMMAEKIPPLTPATSPEMARYLELKRLAEIAWAAFLVEGYNTETRPSTLAEDAWAYADFMLIESERRSPKP